MSKSSPLTPADIYANQTAILRWLNSIGRPVVLMNSYVSAPRPKRQKVLQVINSLSPLMAYVGKPCPYCDASMGTTGQQRPTRDHIKPKSKGGDFRDPKNKAVCCAKCNADKAHLTIETWAKRLSERSDPRAKIVAHFVHAIYQRDYGQTQGAEPLRPNPSAQAPESP